MEPTRTSDPTLAFGREPNGLIGKIELRTAFEGAGAHPEGWTSEERPDLTDWKEVAKWVHWFYDKEDTDPEDYAALISEAVRAGEIPSLGVLWDGVYYHGLDNPDYEGDLLTAAEHANEQTFLFALYARRNYATLNSYEDRDFEAFADKISRNLLLSDWWSSEANQRAMYDLLGRERDCVSDDESPLPPLPGEELEEAIAEAEAQGRTITAATLRRWIA